MTRLLKLIKSIKEKKLLGEKSTNSSRTKCGNQNMNKARKQFVKQFNSILVKHGFKKTSLLDLNNNQSWPSMGSLLFDRFNSVHTSDDEFKADVVKFLVSNQSLMPLNEIKNFLNQSLLHVLSSNETYDLSLCELIVKKNERLCLLEDNYRQTPLSIACKANKIDLVRVYCQTMGGGVESRQTVLWSCYQSCLGGRLEVVKFLFEKFGLRSEHLVYGEKSGQRQQQQQQQQATNPFHVSCYNAHLEVIKFLLAKSDSPLKMVNMTLNEYRDSRPLDEAFKGYLVQAGRTSDFEPTINFLIENGAKFSPNFQLAQFQLDDLEFLHLLKCCSFLFRFKLDEIVSVRFDFDLFFSMIYARAQKVIKDYKYTCLYIYLQLIVHLNSTGQYVNFEMRNFSYLKERNAELYSILDEQMFKMRKLSFSLKGLSIVCIRNSIARLGLDKINQLDIPRTLKQDLFSCKPLALNLNDEKLFYFNFYNLGFI